jgi:hypothetical protein
MRPKEKYILRQFRFDELNNETLKAWESLEERALVSNAFLSPHFVIPAIRHLENSKVRQRMRFLFVLKREGNRETLVGVGIFMLSLGTLRFPLPCLVNYSSPHSYLSGLLLDRDEAEGALKEFFCFFRRKNACWQGVEFGLTPAEGPQYGLISSIAEEFGLTWSIYRSSQRAVFSPSKGGEVYLKSWFSSGRIKEFRRMKRRLEEKGSVCWRSLFGDEVDERTIDHLLDLEHMGWKNESRTSLRSTASNEAFSKEMMRRFRDAGRLFFTELSLNGNIIASTSNLISGMAGFAFKIGWHQDYAKMAPGLLNEVEFIRQAPALCGNLLYIDSGAVEGSFIDRMWVERRNLISGVFATTPLGRKTISGIKSVKKIKRWYSYFKGEQKKIGSRT